MNASVHHTANFYCRAWRSIGLLVLVLLLSVPATLAQNTKGDKPVSTRESRFKTPFQKGNQKRRPASTKRVRSKEKSVAGRANAASPRRRATGMDRPGKPIRPIVKSQPSTKQKAWRGDIAGYRIRSRTSTGSSRNVYPQYGKYTHNPSRKPKRTENAVSNRTTLSRLKTLQTPDKPSPGKRRKVVPRSASSSFTARRSTNVYAHFPRPKRKGEKAITTDIAGRPLRKKNFESPRPGVVSPTFKPYHHRKPMGDKAYSGKSQGGYRSATRAGQPWQGDVAGRKIRGRNFSSKKSIEGQPILPSRKNKDRYSDRAYRGKAGWYQTITRSGETRPGKGPLPARVPGVGADGIDKFQGRTKGGRPIKGGGSVSGRTWNNDGRAIAVRIPQQGARAALFQGNIKSKRPEKGGGSVSGRVWNNNGQPLAARIPKQGARAALFQGNIKGKRPEKGGGSVSGRLWNNKETPIAGKTPPESARKISGFPGRMKRFEVQPGFADQGESFTGYIKLKKFKKEYIQNPNASEESTKKRRPDKTMYQSAGLQVKVKEKESGKKPHGAEGALPGIKPTRSTVKASEYARSVRRTFDYIHNPSSADEALKTREPGKAFARSAAYQGNIKMQKFILFEKNRALHPDTKFIKTNKNNVDEEKDAVTNFKLWWARLFKKQENQPDHLKYKGKKPRYDKGEEGMWNE